MNCNWSQDRVFQSCFSATEQLVVLMFSHRIKTEHVRFKFHKMTEGHNETNYHNFTFNTFTGIVQISILLQFQMFFFVICFI